MENAPRKDTNKEIVLDADWYAEYKEIAAFEAFNYLDGNANNRAEQRQKFLAGEIENPSLDYPKLDKEELNKMESRLRAFKEKILTPEDLDAKALTAQKEGTVLTPKEQETQLVQRLYRWRVNEKIAEVLLLKAAAEQNMGKFKFASEYVYGYPTPEVFGYTVNAIRKHAEDAQDKAAENPALAEAAKQLLAVLPQTDNTQSAKTFPDANTVSRVQSDVQAKMQDLLTLPLEQSEYTAEDMKPILENALRALKADGWHVAISPDKSLFSVNQDEQTVYIPAKGRATQQRLKELILHELGTHVRRRLNGERTKLQLLGLGLDRYDKGEEGAATLAEQSIQPNTDDYGHMDRHFGISLAVGQDGVKRDFRQTFEILKQYYYFERLRKGLTGTNASIEKASEQAYGMCVRIFRGTDCKTPGVAFTKDLLYAEGNIGVWDVVGKEPKDIVKLYIGKFDIANERHISILTKLGIIEEDIQAVEQA